MHTQNSWSRRKYDNFFALYCYSYDSFMNFMFFHCAVTVAYLIYTAKLKWTAYNNSLMGAGHLTPASSAWTQLSKFKWGQLTSLDSVPMQFTSSRKIDPVPWPNWALDTASASAAYEKSIIHVRTVQWITRETLNMRYKLRHCFTWNIGLHTHAVATNSTCSIES